MEKLFGKGFVKTTEEKGIATTVSATVKVAQPADKPKAFAKKKAKQSEPSRESTRIRE
jgi:hypothetical protein